jgi:hypothetical protein
LRVAVLLFFPFFLLNSFLPFSLLSLVHLNGILNQSLWEIHLAGLLASLSSPLTPGNLSGSSGAAVEKKGRNFLLLDSKFYICIFCLPDLPSASTLLLPPHSLPLLE